MSLMSHKEIENLIQDLRREINYVVDRKLQYIRDQFEKEMSDMELYYNNEDKLTDL
jgi:hypothetical protein